MENKTLVVPYTAECEPTIVWLKTAEKGVNSSLSRCLSDAITGHGNALAVVQSLVFCSHKAVT